MWHGVRLFPHTHTELIPTCVCFFFHIRLVLTKPKDACESEERETWQNKKRKGKLSFSTCQSCSCQSVTRTLTITGCHHSVIRTVSGEAAGRWAEDWQSSPSSVYSTVTESLLLFIHTHTHCCVGSQQIKHVRRSHRVPPRVIVTEVPRCSAQHPRFKRPEAVL